jgi:hypothetical protein
MKSTDDAILSNVSIRIKDPQTLQCIGSGVIYNSDHLGESLYVLTAAHCLFKDGEVFKDPYDKVVIDFYDSESNSYFGIIKEIDSRLVSKDANNDVAVLIFKYAELEGFAGKIPKVLYAKQKLSFNNFIVKGFPNATQGKELDVIFPTWKQQTTEVYKFQMELKEDYSPWAVEGFSGSGVFLQTDNTMYLFGIFARYRASKVGKVIYCQYLDGINELLKNCYQPEIRHTYVGENGLNQLFFEQKINKAVHDLGPRFNEKLNFRLPIGMKINELSKDLVLKSRVFKIFDSWLTEKSYRRLPESEHVGEAENKLQELRDKVKKWLNEVDFRADKEFDTQWIFGEINNFYEFLTAKIHELLELRREKEKDLKKTDNDYLYRPAYHEETERLWEIIRINREFLEQLTDDINVDLINFPFLIIQGEAGCGKSHLLGDIATENLKKGVPSLLLLGQHFNSIRSISANILEQLDLQCSFAQFLKSLDEIGRQINSRVILLIDAINESKTSVLWKEGLAGFIQEVSSYRFIGVALTIRSTYFNSVIPENIKINPRITLITHEGFRGNEYEALSLFCDFYKLKQPTFPILSPEFTNPLFLQLVCIGVKDSHEKSFPVGLLGIKKVFDLYLEAINNKLVEKTEYAHRKSLVKTAVNKVASICYQKEGRMLPIDEAFELFDNEFARFPNLLNDLIQENVFIKNMFYDYNRDEEYESIYFAYERFGDYYIAEELLNSFGMKEELIAAFNEDGELFSLVDNYEKGGILEAMSVLLPEKYAIEIFEVFAEIIHKEKNSDEYRDKTNVISSYFFRSLTWRSIQSIDAEKMDNWLSNGDLIVGNDKWMCKLFELTAIKGHPLNSDRLHFILKQFSLADRDSFWQLHLLEFGKNDHYGSALPIKRLIDWAWTKGISRRIDFETARLTAQSLSWLLASTCVEFRDRTTKAIVNLLENQPEALLCILKAFRKTNDMYILERLYAAAYGCVLRDSRKDSAMLIANYVYASIFKSGRPPKNILLRDYARNICEYAIYLNKSVRFNPVLLRPPYKSEFPVFPDKKDIKSYKIEYDSVNKKYSDWHGYNKIYNSVVEDDFGNKIIDPVIREFTPVRIGMDQEIILFKKGLNRKEKKLLGYISDNLKYIHMLENLDTATLELIYNTEEKRNESIEKAKFVEETILKEFQPEKKEWIENNAIPHLEMKLENKGKDRMFLSSNPVKYWIVKRSFELGYDKDLHGNFDSGTLKYNNRHDNQIERIGKKYQWIAYYEVLSMIVDNFEMQKEWGSEKSNFYKGAWQLYLRNIDPAYTTKNLPDEEFEDELGIHSQIRYWWSEPIYMHWNIPSKQWALQLEDIPSVKEIILKKDSQGMDWIYLQQYISWRQPKNLGEDKYFSANKRFRIDLQAYLVKKKDKKKIMTYLSDKNLINHSMPQNRESYSRLINREKFWSPAYFDEGEDYQWEFIRNTDYKVMTATTTAKGSMEHDKSGANATYNIPCQKLFEGMHLAYSANDGDFTNAQGELIVTNVNPDGILIQLNKLEEFLVQNNMEIFWTVVGEKISDLGNHNYDFGVPCGIFTLEKGEIKGEMKMYKRD